MAADDVATAVARIAVGVLVNGTVEVVGRRTVRPAHAPEVVGESGDRPEIGDRKLLGIDLGSVNVASTILILGRKVPISGINGVPLILPVAMRKKRAHHRKRLLEAIPRILGYIEEAKTA